MFRVMFTSKAEGLQSFLVYFWQGTADIWIALVPRTEELGAHRRYLMMLNNLLEACTSF